MPRPTKANDELLKDLETAAGLVVTAGKVRSITRLRIRQAIQRHPDLANLLRPVEAEFDETQTRLDRAKQHLDSAMQ